MRRIEVTSQDLVIDVYNADSSSPLLAIRSLSLERAGDLVGGIPVLACEVAGLRDALARAMAEVPHDG